VASQRELHKTQDNQNFTSIPTMAELNEEAQVKYDLLTRRLQEVLGGDIIKQILAEGKTPKGYWGESHRRVSMGDGADREQVLQLPVDVSNFIAHLIFELDAVR
jgi:hypothetical protein